MAVRNLGRVKGDPGEPASVTIGTVTSVNSWQEAKVINVGSKADVILNIEIPRGEAGPRGETGAPGTNGTDGKDGVDGRDGRAATIEINSVEMIPSTDEPRVVNNGSENAASLDFYIPRPEGADPDTEFIENSENTVQSKVIQEALNSKANAEDMPTKVSDLTNDREFVSSATVESMIEDALVNAASIAMPIDSELSAESTNPVQNIALTEEFGKRPVMTVENVLNTETQTKEGERVTLTNDNHEVSILLRGEEDVTFVLTQNFAERIPTIVSELPTEGSVERLYLVPASGTNNYSMHIWMEVDGVMKYVSIQSGGEVDLSGYAQKSEAIKSIGVTPNVNHSLTLTRADNSTTTVLYGHPHISTRIEKVTKNFSLTLGGGGVSGDGVSAPIINGYKCIAVIGGGTNNPYVHIANIAPSYSNNTFEVSEALLNFRNEASTEIDNLVVIAYFLYIPR